MTNPLPPFDDLPPPPPALDQPPTPLASLSADVAAHAAHSGSGGKASLHSTLRHLHLVDSPSRSAADELSGSMRPDSPANYAATSLHQCDPAEKAAFVKHINDVLVDAVELQHVLPIDPKSEEIFSAVSDGILLGKLINASVPDTIDESKMIMRFRDERSRTYHQLQNHLLCIEGARRIGAKIVNVGPEDLVEGKPYLVFGLLWQIIKVGLLKDISVSKHPEMFADMADAGVDMSKLPAEELLLKWFNWHLKKCKSGLTVTNFSADMKSSEAYAYLMSRLMPEAGSLDVLLVQDLHQRAQLIIRAAESQGMKTFVTADDIVAGNEKLNLAFVASMFNKTIGMAPVAEEMMEENAELNMENSMLKSQMSDMEMSMSNLAKERAQLNSEVAALREMKSNLNGAVDGLKAEREELAMKIQKMYGVNEKLTQHIHSIDNEKRVIEQSKERLADEYENVTAMLLRTTEELEKEKMALESSETMGNNLSSDLEIMRARQAKMEFLIEHLKMERLRSDMHVERLRILYNSFPSTEALCTAIYKSLTLETIQQGASKVGYLTKKARNSNSWKYRFFVLRDNFLFYYKSAENLYDKPNGVVRVDDSSLRFAENPTKKDLKDQWLLCIELPNNNESIKHNSFYVAGEDADLQEWKDRITESAGYWTKRSMRKK